jgi:hypothetical protein
MAAWRVHSNASLASPSGGVACYCHKAACYCHSTRGTTRRAPPAAGTPGMSHTSQGLQGPSSSWRRPPGGPAAWWLQPCCAAGDQRGRWQGQAAPLPAARPHCPRLCPWQATGRCPAAWEVVS